MATTSGILVNPTEGSGSITSTSLRRGGFYLAIVALGGAMLGFAGSLGAAQLSASDSNAVEVATIGLWTFGLATATFGTAKLGIASVLLAIVRRIGTRAEAVAFALPQLKPAATGTTAYGEERTPQGRALVTERAPQPLLIHRLAAVMWLPALAMGAMALYGGFALSLVAAGNVATDPQLAGSQRAWVQGLQFLGEGLLLSGISFLLARVLGTIRARGGDVQQSLGLAVHTLRMPATAKVFVVLMMTGLMISVAQLLGYASVAGMTDPTAIAAASAFLGPLRELGLGLLLAGIVLALATIAKALDFQSSRIASILTRGQ
jgi:hypothetical protein